jgi:putative methyltransferase (TIGR04325 family)
LPNDREVLLTSLNTWFFRRQSGTATAPCLDQHLATILDCLMTSKLKKIIVRAVLHVPFVRSLRDRHHYSRFLSNDGYASFYGVFDSFDDARKQLPPSPEFNNRDLAAEYLAVRARKVFAYDYPVIYWLSEAFRSGATSVFDLGGSVGVHYYAYKAVMTYPASLKWEVFETPEIVKLGGEVAQRSGVSKLSFTDTLLPNKLAADIWISAGALQYIESCQVGTLLQQCSSPPKYIILNKLPLYDGDDFVVTQNIGEGCFAPSYVYNRGRLIKEIEDCGYHLLASWDAPERKFHLPGHPERSFGCFSGLCFGRAHRNSAP